MYILRRQDKACSQAGISCAQTVDAHSPGHSLKVPDRDPVAILHQSPNLFKQLGYAVAVAQARVASDSLYGLPNPVLLAHIQASDANYQARDEQQSLSRVRRAEGFQYPQGLLDSDVKTSIILGWASFGRR